MEKQTSTFISKYKPYFIDDFHLDPDFMIVLKTMFDTDDLNLIFFGNPNSGKTTFLYAMIREYYHLARDASMPESNILFINNLKEQGIQYFRSEMKTFCRSKCSIYNRKKLIIIDDMDTINEQCQQVFRNYIDKYKHNVHFIAVCSNIQKIIESIQSRVNILKIPPLTTQQTYEIMNHIIVEENLQMDNASKDYLLKNSGNSIRNIINNLEKIFILGEPINLELCKKLCSNINVFQFEDFIRECLNNNIKNAISILYNIHDYGYSVIDILDYFFYFIKTTELLTEEQKYQIIPIICKYTTIFHSIREDSIELALFARELQLCILHG
jgi:DNA polymerase III delta prime subunit